MIKKKSAMKKSIFILAALFFTYNAFSQTTYSAGLNTYDNRIRSAEEGFAAEEFRRGVQSYYKGSYNEAIVQFEKALSYLPDDNLILEWLGNSYYKSGMEGSALSYWQTASDNGYGGLLLQNKIEIVRERRITGDSTDKLMRLSEAGSFSGLLDGNLIFSGPVSILPNNDGTFWVTAYNTNELLKINLNGLVLNRITGPLNGFDRPLDIIALKNGSLLLSESAGNRLSLLDSKGFFQKYIGTKGRKVGEMVGPQYLAEDDYGRIYVTDFGNRRVDVFDAEGNGLFYFGTKTTSFTGLKCPTGIAVYNDSIFVADEDKGCIYEFDRSGNFIRQLVEDNTFKKPEAIKIYQQGLLVCDQNKLIGVEADTGALFEYARTGNAPSRVTTAIEDVNNNVIVSDFLSNEIYIMSKMQELIGGLFVQIENVDASAFPNVTFEIKVENRHRQPVVGLQANNFYISENKRPAAQVQFLGAGSNNSGADITLVIDRSASSEYKEEIETAVKEIAASMKEKSILRLVSAGQIPVLEYVGSPEGVKNFNIESLKNPQSKNTSIDLALRLAANDLINADRKRSIIFISDGNVSSSSFEKYTLAELSSYLNNNIIGFSFIQLSQKAVAAEYDYLISNTRGELYYVYRPESLSSVVSDIINQPNGIYQLSYLSSLPTNFGENFLPLEIEVYLLNRSGRAESGYFAPLE